MSAENWTQHKVKELELVLRATQFIVYGCAMLVKLSSELWSGRHLELDWRTLDPAVKPFGSTVKKEARIEVETSGKNLRLCSASRGIRKWWAWAPGAPEKGPKIFLKKITFEKCEKKECVANTYVVSRCRSVDWYIWLRNVCKMEQ